jgi:trk system potassium uptake protein TrkH
MQTEGRWMGVYYALFHSISAFNNAGFALYPDSLSPYVGNPLVNFVILFQVVLGGLGFIVIFDLVTRYRNTTRRPLTLHTKIVLTVTALLIGIAFVVVALFEWTNPATLGMLPPAVKLQAALFQAITPRTAGFNTLDYADMRNASQVFTILLMFIGGSPGSTAGGIKTVTFFVLVGCAWSLGRGYGELSVFRRRVALDTVVKAGMIAVIGVMMSGCALTLLTLTDGNQDTFALLFETASAAGTVGLSLGVTSELSPLGKLIIISQMYLGRLGPLTFALALIERKTEKDYAYPIENIVIG